MRRRSSDDTSGEPSTGDVLVADDGAAIQVLLTLNRLAQQATLYDADNKAQIRALESAAEAACAYGQVTGRNITIFFSERAIYIGRRLLRASRSVYAVAATMRALLSAMGANQITIAHDVPLQELRVLQEFFGRTRGGKNPTPAPEGLTRIGLRVGQPPRDFTEFDALSAEERALKVYALAVVIVRRFYEQLWQGSSELPTHLRRICHQLIHLAETASPAFLSATVARPAHDDAGRAVATAFLALCMAHRLTSDPRLLRSLAMAAVLCDTGKSRVAAMNLTDSRGAVRVPVLGEAQYGELPGATAVVTTALGKMTDAGMLRSVLVYEVLHQAYGTETGPVYDGDRQPALASRLIARARGFQDLLTSGSSAADALATLVGTATDRTDMAALELLMSTLRVLAPGTLVELRDGRRARVVGTSPRAGARSAPVVQLVGDPGTTPDPQLLDLGEVTPGVSPLRVARIVAQLDRARASQPLPDMPRPAAAPVSPPREAHDYDEDEPETVPPPAPIPVPTEQRDDDIFIMLGPTGRSGAMPDLRSIPPQRMPVLSDLPQRDVRPEAEEGASIRPVAPATAQGTLAKTPFVHLLVYVLDHRLSGTLVLDAPRSGRSAIFLERGIPCKARAAQLVATLDGTLLRMGLLDEQTLRQSLRSVARSRRLHGQHLVDLGLLSAADLVAALRQQLVDKIGYMFRLPPATRYTYFADVDLLADYGGAQLTPCEPLSLVMMGVRKYLPPSALEDVVGRVARSTLRLHPRSDTDRLGLKDDERAIVDRLRASDLTLEALLLLPGVDAVLARRVLYALLITRSIDLSGQTRLPVGVDSTPPR